MAGYEKHIPVIACCETYKFSDKVQLETAAFEETADPLLLQNPLASSALKTSISASTSSTVGQVKGKGKMAALPPTASPPDLTPQYLNVVHDITSSKYINVVITEIGLIPCTSIPVVLREYRPFNSI
jgi:translation initiation factor eIF-2B subunit delta